jgi:hypothetical protein
VCSASSRPLWLRLEISSSLQALPLLQVKAKTKEPIFLVPIEQGAGIYCGEVEPGAKRCRVPNDGQFPSCLRGKSFLRSLLDDATTGIPVFTEQK